MTKARVDVEGNTVVFRPVGLAKFWALRFAVHVPLAAISSVRTTDDIRSVFWGTRWFGTGFPGVIVAGWMGWPWRRAWWCVGRRRPVLVVDAPTRGTKRIVVSADEPEVVAARLRAATGARA